VYGDGGVRSARQRIGAWALWWFVRYVGASPWFMFFRRSRTLGDGLVSC